MNPALAALLAKAKERAALKPPPPPPATIINLTPIAASLTAHIHSSADGITYNENQQAFINTVASGQSAILIGAAGTGKTTCMKGALQSLIQNGHLPHYQNDGHKHLKDAQYGIIICAFTRRAVANIRKNLSNDLKANCITVHAALEYAPEYYDVLDPITNEYKQTMRFAPTRNKHRPLSETIRYVVIEEASMLGTDLFAELMDALPPGCKFIFLGDIQQLPPVFGPAILGYKMLELPCIELTEVYRQALDSPIISLAHRILSGKPMPLTELTEWNEKYSGKGLSFHPIKKKLHAEHITPRIAAFLKKEIADGNLDINTDMILIPFNKGLGTDEINKEIAQYLTLKRGEKTYEVIAGFQRHYLAVGDKVLVEKEDAEIISINKNSMYFGNIIPKPASVTLDRWGFDSNSMKSLEGELDNFDLDVDAILASLNGAAGDKEERKNEASHVITVRMKETGEEISLNKSAEINALLLGYALTVHKSQGSEWRKVYCIFHQSHNTMVSRELVYTAVTRARQELYVICESDTFVKGITSQKVKGNTLQEKAEYFKGRKENGI